MPSDVWLLWQQGWLIARREYRERVRSKAFVLNGTALLATHANANQRIAIVPNDTQYLFSFTLAGVGLAGSLRSAERVF